MDPFCKVSISGISYATEVKDNAGKTPKWDEVWEYLVKDPETE